MPIAWMDESKFPEYYCAGVKEQPEPINIEESPSSAARRYAKKLGKLQAYIDNPENAVVVSGTLLISMDDVKQILEEE